MSSEVVQAVVARVRAEVPALVDHLARHIVAEVPFYAAGGAGDLRSTLHANVQASLDSVLGAPHDPGPAAETGRLRARQNAPLADVLSAYRLGYTHVWAAIVEAGRTAQAVPPDLLIDLAQTVFETHNRDADVLIDAFRDEAQHLAIKHERERAALIDVLLSEEPSLATLLEVSRALRLPMDGTFVVVAAATGHGQDPMPRAASALAAADVPSVWRLHYDIAIGVLCLQSASRNELARQLLTRHATGPVGVSPVFNSLRRTAWALELARLVLDRQGSATGVEQFQDSPLNLLLVGGRDTTRATANAVLGELLDQPPETRDTLLHTLHAWVESGGSADRTGEVLHCHPNTVRKRLRLLEHYTRRNLGEPAGVAEIVAAAHAWSQLRTPG